MFPTNVRWAKGILFPASQFLEPYRIVDTGAAPVGGMEGQIKDVKILGVNLAAAWHMDGRLLPQRLHDQA